ncbi:MAG TPA: DUF4855 domain-containing protein [Bacilli bacterium]|nr:DUF4855 domain-containing protein [Bacilli bacterium]
MKRQNWRSALPALLLLGSLSPWTLGAANVVHAQADRDYTITKIDVVTKQEGAYEHPEQITVERTLSAGALRPERLHRTILPAGVHQSITMAPGGHNVYVGNRQDGLIWEIDPDNGKVFRQIKPKWAPSTNIQGLAVGAAEDLYVYYKGSGKLQRISSSGELWDSWTAPTNEGNSLAFVKGSLYLLDGKGTVTQIDATSKKISKQVTLKRPDGQAFAEGETANLFWDGKYWNITTSSNQWKLNRYTVEWKYVDSLDLQQGVIDGCLFNGREYLTVNTAQNLLTTVRMVEDDSAVVDQVVTPHYQYLGNVLTTTEAQRMYPLYDDRNVLLVYSDAKKMKQEDFKPLVSYLDSDGKRQGAMFDSFVFLASSQVGMFNKVTDEQAWSKFRKQALDNIAVLDKEWGAHTEALQTESLAKVYLAVPAPNPQDPLDVQEAAMHRYIDDAMTSLYGAHFEHIEFRGFYWHSESAAFADPLVVDFNRYVHQKGLLSMWIPYFGSPDANSYKALGFDEVFSQPNYYFEKYQPNLNRFHEVAESGARFGKGVEMELDGNVLADNDYRERFLDYLKYGSAQGWLQASKAWYAGTDGINQLYENHDTLYDEIYHVIKGTYKQPSVTLTTPKKGTLQGSLYLSSSNRAKLRLNVLHQRPFQIEKVIVQTDEMDGSVLHYQGTLRVDEELTVRDGALVKQAIGKPADDLRIGFNEPLTLPVDVWIVPQGKTLYSDVSGYHVQAPTIMKLTNLGVMSGEEKDGKTLFHPDGEVERGAFATLLTRLDDLTASQKQRAFADAQAPSIAAVVDNELMQSVDAIHFAPDRPMKQEEIAVALVRLMHLNGIRADVPAGMTIRNQEKITPEWLDLVLEGKVLGLYGDKFGLRKFDPQELVTRADLSDVINNTLKRLQPDFAWESEDDSYPPTPTEPDTTPTEPDSTTDDDSTTGSPVGDHPEGSDTNTNTDTTDENTDDSSQTDQQDEQDQDPSDAPADEEENLPSIPVGSHG